MENKPATIKEIANRLNVSVSTVSRALHNHSSIGAHTKMQVRKLAAELNYEPNHAAVSFKQGRSMTIGVILPNLGEEYFSMAINGIEDVATRNKYTVLIGQSHDDFNREEQIVETMRRHRVDGIIVSLAKTTSKFDHFLQLKKSRIPVVFFDRVPDIKDAFCVSCDLENSSTELVDWLFRKGHKRIGFLMGPDQLIHSGQRLDGYYEGLKKNNIKKDQSLIEMTDLSKEGNRKATAKLLKVKNAPTAIVAFNDYVALDAIKFSREQGLKINKDICFVSFANLPITSYMDDMPLASVEQFPYLQAEKATGILLDIIHGKGDDSLLVRKTVLQSKVVVNA